MAADNPSDSDYDVEKYWYNSNLFMPLLKKEEWELVKLAKLYDKEIKEAEAKGDTAKVKELKGILNIINMVWIGRFENPRKNNEALWPFDEKGNYLYGTEPPRGKIPPTTQPNIGGGEEKTEPTGSDYSNYTHQMVIKAIYGDKSIFPTMENAAAQFKHIGILLGNIAEEFEKGTLSLVGKDGEGGSWSGEAGEIMTNLMSGILKFVNETSKTIDSTYYFPLLKTASSLHYAQSKFRNEYNKQVDRTLTHWESLPYSERTEARLKGFEDYFYQAVDNMARDVIVKLAMDYSDHGVEIEPVSTNVPFKTPKSPDANLNNKDLGKQLNDILNKQNKDINNYLKDQNKGLNDYLKGQNKGLSDYMNGQNKGLEDYMNGLNKNLNNNPDLDKLKGKGIDTNGDGKIDGYDTNGDGKIDTGLDGKPVGDLKRLQQDGFVPHLKQVQNPNNNLDLNKVKGKGIDTNGDGKIDGYDTNGDGKIDTDLNGLKKIQQDGFAPHLKQVQNPNNNLDLNKVKGKGTPIDVDGDGKPDGYDTDGDGKIDKPLSPNQKLIDSDGDGKPDGIDTDGDGKIDKPLSPNQKLIDSDGDGKPDGIDTNGDGKIDKPLYNPSQYKPGDYKVPPPVVNIPPTNYPTPKIDPSKPLKFDFPKYNLTPVDPKSFPSIGKTAGGLLSKGKLPINPSTGLVIPPKLQSTPVVKPNAHILGTNVPGRVVAGIPGRSGVGTGAGGMPMMPMSPGMGMGHGNQNQNKDRERETWLVEDEDIWSSDSTVAPTVLGRTEP